MVPSGIGSAYSSPARISPTDTQADSVTILFYMCGAGRAGLSAVQIRVVPDVPRGDDEDDVLGDVGRMVADALEMPRDENQVERRLDGRRILQHVGEQLAENL